MDDWLAEGHTTDELIALATTDLRKPPANEPSEEGEEKRRCPYRETPHGIVWEKQTQDGPTQTQLTNFKARIVGEIEEDDGAEKTLAFEIEASLPGRKATFRVPTTSFASLAWAVEHLGAGAIVSPGMGLRDHARAAIQHMSGDPPRRTVYRYLGWVNLGTAEEPNWVYLHGGGAIGGKAPGTVSVSPPDALGRFVLPEPPVGEERIAAVRASLRLLDLAPDQLTYPVFSAIYRAPLGMADEAVFLVGPTGVFKSEIAALAQQHFGAEMDRLHLPANWSSTDNFLEGLAFAAKDVLLVIDDFAPHGSPHDVTRYHARADRILRGVGNSSGRGRLRADLSTRPPRPPRGLIFCTGEDIPAGHSLKARNTILEVEPGTISPERLSDCQRDGKSGLLALSMSAYLEWLAHRYDRMRQGLLDEKNTLRDRLRHRLPAGHARTSENAANLLLGLTWFLQFAVDIGVINQAEAHEHLRRGISALLTSAQDQDRHHADSDPVLRFIRLLSDALGAGEAHIANSEGNAPINPVAWGWRELPRTTGEHLDPVLSPQGKCIGYIVYPDGDRTGEADLFLIPTAAYNVAQRMGSQSPDGITITERQLNKRLWDRNMLLSRDKTRQTHTIRKMLAGSRREVLHLRANALMPQSPDQPDQSAHDGRVHDEADGDDDRHGQVLRSGSEPTHFQPDHETLHEPDQSRSNGAHSDHDGQDGQVLSCNRLAILAEGARCGYPSLSWPTPNGRSEGWASGEPAWTNRAQRADEGELSNALAAARAIP